MLTMTVCAALSAAGLAVAFLTAYRRRYASATRIAAFALLPVGLAMAGLVELGGDIGQAVGGWASDLVLEPTVWVGFAVLALAVLLYLVARLAVGRAGERDRAPGTSARGKTGGGRRDSAPSPRGGAELSPSKDDAGGKAQGNGEDFSDIEAILKKHGI